MQMKWYDKVTIIIVVLIVVMFSFGLLLKQFVNLGEGSYEIGKCKASWSWEPHIVRSEYCPNATFGNPKECLSDPMVEQHNALVDLILCACDDAKQNNYGDLNTNQKIEHVYEQLTGYKKDVKAICEAPDLAKWYY